MDGDMSDFVAYAKEIISIMQKREIELADESLVIKATSAYAAINPADASKFFGKAFTSIEWNGYVTAVLNAKETVRLLKVEKANEKIKLLNEKLLALPDTFDLSLISELCELTAQIDNLKGSQRSLLNMDKYDALVKAFGEYYNSVNEPISEIDKIILGK